jgi:hypothetical protein
VTTIASTREQALQEEESERAVFALKIVEMSPLRPVVKYLVCLAYLFGNVIDTKKLKSRLDAFEGIGLQKRFKWALHTIAVPKSPLKTLPLKCLSFLNI